jgi:hypothetical protein
LARSAFRFRRSNDPQHGRARVWRLDYRSFETPRYYLELISMQRDEALGRLREFVQI